MTDSSGLLSHIGRVTGTCLHCGLCLPECPTYERTGDERSSPRGRIRLLRSVLDGTLDPGGDFAEEMNFCLDCRACETACPAGVRYGELVEHARTIITERKIEPAGIRIKKFIVLRLIFGSKKRFDLFTRLIRFYRRSGLREAVERSGILGLFPAPFGRLVRSVPDAADESFSGHRSASPDEGDTAGGTGLLTGCIMNSSFPGVHQDTVALMEQCGKNVVVPAGQFCCGSLHGHNGDPVGAKRLAAGLMKLFPGDLDTIVVNSAGCGAFMKQYGVMFRDEPALSGTAERFAGKVEDVSEFLQRNGFRPSGRLDGVTITYHDACHLLHGQGISSGPRSLLRAVPGGEFVELPDSSRCCGSAGIYNILRPADSDEFLRHKVAHILSTGAGVVVTANPGCHLQIERGLREAGSDIVVTHPVSLLMRGYGR